MVDASHKRLADEGDSAGRPGALCYAFVEMMYLLKRLLAARHKPIKVLRPVSIALQSMQSIATAE
jgi:hypothetical protein